MSEKHSQLGGMLSGDETRHLNPLLSSYSVSMTPEQ